MPASTGRYELLRKRLNAFTRALQGFAEGHLQSVHQTRVASRRLREILPVLQLDSRVARRLGRRLRKVTQRLGPVRELDVLSLLIEEMAASGRFDLRAIRKLGASVTADLKRARPRLLDKLPPDALYRISGKIERIADDLETQKPSREWRWAVDARVTHRALTLKTALAEAGSLYLPERLHVVRIALKKLRYACEVGAETAGLIAPGELRSLKRSQDVLGRLHDLQLLLDRVRRLQASLAPADALMSRKLDTLIAGLENECRLLHARFMHQRTVVIALCDRVAGARSLSAAGRRAAS